MCCMPTREFAIFLSFVATISIMTIVIIIKSVIDAGSEDEE